MRYIVILASLSLSAGAQAPATPTHATAKGVDDCTLETPLRPGVPGSPGHLIPSKVNPNGASELAALMRRMQGDLTAAREAVQHGQSVEPMLQHHRRIRCSWPTSADTRNKAFDQMAIAYLAQVAAFDAAKTDHLGAFNRIVGACKACHANTCGGPLVAIEALEIPVR